MTNQTSMPAALRRSVAFLTVWGLSVASLAADPIIDGILNSSDGYSHGFAVSAEVEKGPTISDAELYLHKGSNGDMSVLLRFPRSLNDNSYGDTRIGWGKDAPSGKNHNFEDLEGSDDTEFFVTLGSGGSLDFVFDFIDSQGGVLVHGLEGEGGVESGNASDILATATSLSRNYSLYGSSHPELFQNGADSPAASSSYVVLDPTFSDWEFSIIYEFKIRGGALGNWDPSDPSSVLEVGTSHHSPNKIAKNKVREFEFGGPIDPPGGGGGGGGGISDVLCAVNTAEQCGTGDAYGMWIPNLHDNHSDWTFEFSHGEFSGLTSGDARLTAVARLGNGNGFSLDVTFTDRVVNPPAGSPKGPIDGSCYTPDTSDWFYYENFTGTLTGLAGTDYEGAVLQVTRREKAFQVGEGANRQTNDLGGSGWFDWVLLQQTSTSVKIGNGSNGDFNFALESCSVEVPTVSISDAKALECEGPMEFEICLSGPTASPVTINYETQDKSAEDGEDYSGGASSIIIPAGTTCVTLSIPLIADNKDERDEEFEVVITSATGATISNDTGKGKIEDCDPIIPEISISDVTVLECEGPAVFEICLSELSRADVTFEYKTKDGSAKKSSDYTETKGTLMIKAGERCVRVEVPITRDSRDENDETFELELKEAENATFADNKGKATIQDCEEKDIEVTISDAVVFECDGPIRFEVCLSENAPEDLTFAYRTIAGTASSGGGDYDGTSFRQFTIDEGQKCVFIEIDVFENRDELDEENFQVLITDGPGRGYEYVRSQATGTIKECEQPPTIPDDMCVVDTALNCGEGAEYGMWLPNLHAGQSDITFEFESAQFTGLQSGDALLTAIATLGNGNGFIVNATFTGRTIVPPSGSPKEPVDPSCYDLDASDWFYYTGLTATLTGLPGTDFEGAELSLTRRGEAFQVGVGANRQTNVLGASGWFNWEQTNQSNPVIDFHDDGNGDFNFDMVECDPVLPEISISGSSVLECESPATFEVCLSTISPVDVTVNYATADGTATAPSDYTASSGSLTIPAGQLCANIDVAISDDGNPESQENFTVVLSGATGAVIGSGTGTGTIEDCEVELPNVSVIDARGFAECDGPAIFEVCLDEITKSAIQITYETRDLTATAGLDYVSTSGTVTIAVGERCAEIRVDVLEDFLTEGDETFELVITEAVGATIDDGVGLATIKDCPPDPITISITDTRAKECEGPMTFQVCLSRVSDVDITVDYATANGTALAGLDYTGGSGTVTIPAGTKCVDLEIPTLEDNTTEPNETFFVNLSNSSGPAISDDQGVGTIGDCPPKLPTISINDISVFECKGPAVFEVCLSEVSENDVTVSYSTANGSAIAPADYASGSGVLTIPANTQCVTFTVDVVDDGSEESPETFLINLSNATNATIADDQGVGTIHDCDPVPPTVSIANTRVEECNGPATFTVCLSEVSSEDVTVNYTTVDGTATSPADYVSGSGTVTILAGEECATFTVDIVNDGIDETPETFLVNLSDPTNATIDDGQGVATIHDCEKPEISITGKIVSECDDEVVLDVCLSVESDFDVTVEYATSNGTADAGDDYTSTTGTLTILAGQLCGTVTVGLLNENVAEPDETFLVTISNAQGAVITDDVATVTIKDCTIPPDEDPTITILDPDLVKECEADQIVFTVCLNEAGDQVITVNWTTQDGSATAGQDYVAASGTLTFQPGEVKPDSPIVIALIDDAIDEAPEQFSVVLSNPTNSTIADGTGVATIQDCGDDPTAVELIGFSVEQDGLGGVVLKWETASEFETAGFELHRANTSGSTGFSIQSVTTKMVLAKGSTGEGASYSYADQPGYGRFTYQLEEIELDGHRERIGTIAVDVAPMFTSIEPTSEGIVLTFPTMEGWEFSIDVRDSWNADGEWAPLAGAPHASGRVIDTETGNHAGRFYRITATRK